MSNRRVKPNINRAVRDCTGHMTRAQADRRAMEQHAREQLERIEESLARIHAVLAPVMRIQVHHRISTGDREKLLGRLIRGERVEVAEGTRSRAVLSTFGDVSDGCVLAIVWESGDGRPLGVRVTVEGGHASANVMCLRERRNP